MNDHAIRLETSAPESAPLVLLRDKSPNGADPTVAPDGFFCASPGRGVRWLRADGELEYVRCGASNRCDYCAMLAACENAVVVRLDAYDAGRPRPVVGITLTTHSPRFSMDELREASRLFWRDVRRDHPDAQYCGFLEWTQGVTIRSGGHRRPHMHYLVKGVPAADAIAYAPRVSELWRRHTGAWVVECRPLYTPLGAIAYLTLHHHKREQGPPPGIKRVRRLRASKRYFARPVAELRAEARELLKSERLYAELVNALSVPDGFPKSILDELIAERIDAARASLAYDRPRLVNVHEVQKLDKQSGELSWEFRYVVGFARRAT